MDVSWTIYIYIFLRIGIDLFLLKLKHFKKTNFHRILFNFFILTLVFGYYAVLTTGGIYATQVLLAEKVSFNTAWIVLPVYTIGFEVTRFLIGKRYRKELKNSASDFFLKNLFYSSGAILFLLGFLILYFIADRIV